MNLNIAESIKRLRIENNLTQADLADCLSVSPQAVSVVAAIITENSRVKIRLDRFIFIFLV